MPDRLPAKDPWRTTTWPNTSGKQVPDPSPGRQRLALTEEVNDVARRAQHETGVLQRQDARKGARTTWEGPRHGRPAGRRGGLGVADQRGRPRSVAPSDPNVVVPGEGSTGCGFDGELAIRFLRRRGHSF